ncbi:MAG: hypothetical protein HC828_14025 [Blastochloris sp.]|nr:hypothetical protein [Blastochloris sp.]
MSYISRRAAPLVCLLLLSITLLAACGAGVLAGGGNAFYVQDVIQDAQMYAGQEITIDGAYVWRPDPMISVLALGVSTLDSGLDAQPLGEPIWLENFPAEVTSDLHQPGDAVYGFVRVTGRFETGGAFGPQGSYQHRLDVVQAEAIEQIRYVEHRIEPGSLGEGKVSLFELQANPAAYNGQRITTRGYYFWNTLIWVLAEGVATEEGGSSPQPLGNPIWMEGFPPDVSTMLNVGPNNTFVWGQVEVTGTFQTGGSFGKDGNYQSIFFVESATALENASQ